MQKIISGYLWAWKNCEAGKKAVQTLRKFYPDSDIFINVDYDGDIDTYQKICNENGFVFSKNNFQVGYCGNFGDVNVGRECWPKEHTFEWIRGLYEACLKTDSKYMLILEEDVFLEKEISILKTDYSMAIHAAMPSSSGIWRPNHLPNEFMIYSADIGGVASAPGYGAGGGCTFNREHFIKSWEKARSFLWKDYDYLKSINKIIGWQDFIVQFVMMIGGYEIIQYHHAAQHWEMPDWRNVKAFCGDDFEMICGLKDHTLIQI